MNHKNDRCKDRTVLNLPVSKNTRAAKKRRIASRDELAGKLILPHSELQKEFLGLHDLEKNDCYPKLNVMQIQEVAINRCGISPSKVTTDLLLSQAAWSRVEEAELVIHGLYTLC